MLTILLMDYTYVQKLPAWVLEEGKRRAKNHRASLTISAGGSLYCLENNQTKVTNESGIIVECRNKLDGEIEGAQFTFNNPYRAL